MTYAQFKTKVDDCRAGLAQLGVGRGDKVAIVSDNRPESLSPYIANVMIHGANKAYNVALVVPDAEALGRWAQENGASIGNAASNERVRALIAEEIKKHSSSFKNYERPEKFLLVTEDFTTDNGMLTPTLKLKRRNVLARYEQQLEALY